MPSLKRDKPVYSGLPSSGQAGGFDGKPRRSAKPAEATQSAAPVAEQPQQGAAAMPTVHHLMNIGAPQGLAKPLTTISAPPSCTPLRQQPIKDVLQTRFAGQLRGLCNDLLPMLQSRLARDAPLLRLTCKNFHVAKLSCSSSSGVTCYQNRLEYKFLWGRKTQVQMIMYYRDMEGLTLNPRNGVLRFHIKTPLVQFGQEYDAGNREHILSLQFFSAHDMKRFQDVLGPYLPSMQMA